MDDREFNLNPNMSSSSSSPPNVLRNDRLGKRPANNMHLGRVVRSKSAMIDSKAGVYDDSLIKQRVQDVSGAVTKNLATVTVVNHEVTSTTPPSIMDTSTEDGKYMEVDDRRGDGNLGCECRSDDMFAQLCLKCRQVADGSKSDFGHSVVGSICAATTLVNSVNAPMLSSTTHCSRPSQQGSFNAGNSFDMNDHRMTQIDTENPPKFSSKVLADPNLSAAVDSYPENKHKRPRDQQGDEAGSGGMPKDPPPIGDSSQPPLSNDQISNVKSVTSKSGRSEKSASKKDPSAPRKRSCDPKLFFKVNGKHYQRLRKIGSGGSSEVYEVISQDCKIYALKKIKLKGRDYATAFGFCQEIEYLNKLKGKDQIIQLIDYEVTDKALFKEVMSGSMSNKDGRVRDDGYIYMLLEYGEIDLAHMLSHKWRDLDDSRSTIDDNWLRFYWQQILLAVKTIHEERIVHSDLKPANFLLVRGSLKLIDFGIAKAILSDTTNIQRDSQVGTLSYMSPEAFMCGEADANGNIIKCGLPSDIWSLGCILYQMVYGRTPLADYTTFREKLEVITNPNHEIRYEPLSNPWLLDLIKKCLVWERKERWTIPQLLQHPFLVPPIPPQLSNPNLIELVSDTCTEDPEGSRLQQLVRDLIPNIKSVGSGSLTLDQKCTLLEVMSMLCLQLKGQLAYS